MNFLRAHIRSIIWLLVLLAIPLTWYLKVYFNYQGDLAKYDLIDEQAEKYMREVGQEIAQYEANERADTYGGKTPQETWAMFVHALEVGDTDLASKYFIQRKQEEIRDDLRIGKENGVVEALLADFKLIEIEKMSSSGTEFQFITKKQKVAGSSKSIELPFVYTLEKSKISGLWKISNI